MEFEGVIAEARENKILEWGCAHLQGCRIHLRGVHRVCRSWMMCRPLGLRRGKTSGNSLLSVVETPKLVVLLALEVRREYEGESCLPLDYAEVG